MSTRPVTISDLIRERKLLELGCMGCGRHLYVDPGAVGLPDTLPGLAIGARLVCSRCGAINQPIWHPIWARPDARVPGVL